eukprot:5981839-Prymnesium_polylepis.1
MSTSAASCLRASARCALSTPATAARELRCRQSSWRAATHGVSLLRLATSPRARFGISERSESTMPACTHCCRHASASVSSAGSAARASMKARTSSLASRRRLESGFDCSGRWKASNATSCSTCSASATSDKLSPPSAQSSSRSVSCESMHASAHSSVQACRRTGVTSVAPCQRCRTNGTSSSGAGAFVSRFWRSNERHRLSSTWVSAGAGPRASAARHAGQHSSACAKAMIQELTSAIVA